ncbi:negative regulator for alginate biosynthesis [Alcanivorax hongdengensis A-11-3]|uniref:Negative regulator for alginate biosynthesis n=1 Tax=Alcanivorax hongdengensis A-11-3 TaxID=1177179 RepID=L0WCW3_9GAMM|nr:MucB/RseB C-terminal domain-containing protein [Alcanivorax hongdengensis]EKF73942.1 negative regulator for alginate biosynthesis [Alcanivorax hongdengensis A-11-3]
MLRALALSLTLFLPLAVKAEAPSASDLLQQMAHASRSLDYQGRFLYQFGAEVSTMDIRHAVIDGKEYQRLTHLDGRLVEVLRRGDEVLCLHPDGSLTRLAHDQGGPFNLGERLARDVPEQYNVLVDGDSRVAGRIATVLRVAPLDTHRYGYRLWLDDDSHLLLKSETVDGSGVALERVEFVTLALAPRLSQSDFAAPPSSHENALQEVPGNTPDAHLALEAQWLPGGFEAMQEDWRRSEKNRAPVAAQGYSDGLATFTVFVEAVSDGSVEEGVSRVGPTVAVSRRLTAPSGAYLVTLVGEIPQATAERVIGNIRVHDNRH